MARTKTLKELQDLTLKFINSYSSDGEILPVSDNADLLLVIDNYLNIAYYEFVQIDKILVSEDYTILDETLRPDGVTKQYVLPNDYLDFYKVEYNTFDQEITDFSIMGNLLLAKTTSDPITLWYYQLPDELSLPTDVPLIRAQYHTALPLYAAGKWLHQNGKQSDAIDLFTLYNDAKEAVIPTRHKGINKIRTVYGV